MLLTLAAAMGWSAPATSAAATPERVASSLPMAVELPVSAAGDYASVDEGEWRYTSARR